MNALVDALAERGVMHIDMPATPERVWRALRDAPRAEAWRGLHAFAAWLEARRGLLHDAFLQLWTELGRAGFQARLEYALTERGPEPEPAPPEEPSAPEPALAARTEP